MVFSAIPQSTDNYKPAIIPTVDAPLFEYIMPIHTGYTTQIIRKLPYGSPTWLENEPFIVNICMLSFPLRHPEKLIGDLPGMFE